MSLTYSEYVTTMANLLVMEETNANFVQILPTIIDYGEGRCYRDLDLLNTSVTNSSTTLNANIRSFTVPIPASGPYVVVEQVNLIESGSRTPLTAVSKDVLDFIWPSSTAADSSTRPQVFAMIDDTSIAVGPPSGSNVTIETIGRIKPTALSSGNPATYLSTSLPELFVAASMIFGSGWQKNFGAQADDPKMAQSWENQYQMLLQGVDQYASRQKFAGVSWSPKRTEPFATPQRG